jgi:hypothetical protein
MIGQKILKFDEVEDQNIALFKEIFNISLDGELTDSVELGEPLVGGLRKVTVNGVVSHLDLVDLGRSVVYKKAIFKIRGERLV